MSDPFMAYLARERARLEAEISRHLSPPHRDEIKAARLRRAAEIVAKQLDAWSLDSGTYGHFERRA